MPDERIDKQQQQVNKQEFIKINERLQREIAERKRLEGALDALNTELQDFIHLVSHDLREPLRKISSFGMLLKDSLDGKLKMEDLENLELMIDGAERMTQMIEDLLVYSRIDKKATVPEIVDLNEVVEQLEELELISLLEETGTIIEIPKPLPKVYADPVLVRQLLQNLIINGIKNCGDNRDNIKPRIQINAECIKENKIRLELQDNRTSVEKQNHKDIFKMFIRLNSRQEKDGIESGLALCKKIVDRHGGQIGVESKAGVGSTFWFILPESKREENIKLSS